MHFTSICLFISICVLLFVYSVAQWPGCYWTIMPIVTLTHVNGALALNSLNKNRGDIEEQDKSRLLQQTGEENC